MTRPTWKYTNPAELATSGIYTEKELGQIWERIMFPVEIPAILKEIAREKRGHPLGNSKGSLLKLLNENAMERIIENTWTRICTKFLTFGTISAGIIAILKIIHIIKITVDIILQAYVIHSVYGWSVHLLGALWTSVTHFLIYAARRPENTNDNEMGNTSATQELHSTHIAPEPTKTQEGSSSSPNKQFFQLT